MPSERLKVVQNLLDEGSEVAATVFSDVGVYLAYSLLYYYDFYKFENVLLMGRVMSGLGGEIIMNKANEVLKNHGADKKFKILLPTKISEGSDNRDRRVVSRLKTKNQTIIFETVATRRFFIFSKDCKNDTNKYDFILRLSY